MKKKLTNLPLDTLLQTARRAGQNAAANAVAAGRLVSHHDAEVAELRADRELAVEYLKVAMESLDNLDDRAAGLLALRTVAEAYGGLGAAAAEPLTRHFKQTVVERVEHDPAFAKALLDEAATLFLSGEPDAARLIQTLARRD